MVEQFNRSEFMKEKHSLARLEFETYKEKYPKRSEKVSYSDFLKTETPVSEFYVAYEVSFQVSYTGGKDSIFINSNTFEIYSIDGNRDKIEKQIMNSVLDSKGVKSGVNLHPATISAMEKGFSTNIKPRGIERKDIANLSFAEKEAILRNRNVVKGIDSQVDMVNKKGRKGELQLDITHFLE